MASNERLIIVSCDCARPYNVTEELDKKKYNPLENILKDINTKFISLDVEIEKRNNIIFREVLNRLIEKMKEKDSLFKEMFNRVFYGGSYYDGLRVGQPNEFDLDLLLILPKISNPILTTTNKPGFVQLELKDYSTFKQHVDLFKRYKGLEKLLEDEKDCYLDNDKVRKWMESVINLALNSFSRNEKFEFNLPMGLFYAKIRKSGPAFTLIVEGYLDEVKVTIDIDLVPCFEFKKDQWPNEGFLSNPVDSKPNFFIVPKPVKADISGRSNRYWRLSFQEQERELMKINNNQYLKPTVKLLKKMRDVLNLKCIASYYIKTIALWEQKNRSKEFWSTSLSYVFITLLKEFYNCLKRRKICYYWNMNNNLLDDISDITLSNIENNLKRILGKIENNIQTNPRVITKYLLTPEEQLVFGLYNL